MKIKFTPSASSQLALIREIPTVTTGFLWGSTMGTYRIIHSFFPVPFDESNIQEIYNRVFQQFGEHLVGVFFNGCEPFEADWFLEGLVIQAQPSRYGVYYLDAEKNHVPVST